MTQWRQLFYGMIGLKQEVEFIMKYEWRKQEKELYGVKGSPSLITVPKQAFLTIKGKGNPNKADFSERVGVLFSLAYQIKMQYKKMDRNGQSGHTPPEYDDFAVFPLEGVWTSGNAEDPLNKDDFLYTIMIKQPGFISKELFELSCQIVKEKKPHAFLNEVVFDTMEDGLCVQLLHTGAFDDEPASFAKIDAFLKENSLERLNHFHREIYLSNVNRVIPEKRKTILRVQVAKP